MLETDHPARTIWALSGRLDLSAFEAPIEARGSEPGRPATDPRLLFALWLYAYTSGIGRGRELARLCQEHDAYRWLCGGVYVNYHTLNDFRVKHEQALDELFTKVLATLIHHDVVQVQRISQDGTRVRASAGSGSYRRRATLEDRLQEARAHVTRLKKQLEEDPGLSPRQKAARERAAQQKQERLEQALKELPKLEQAKARQRDDKPSKKNAPRVSMTDPEARRMKMSNGGFNPAYNVQISSDPESRAIVGVEITNHGTDHGEDEPQREQVQNRTGQQVTEQLLDGGYVKREAIENASKDNVAIYAPIPEIGKYPAVCIRNPKDSPGVAAWRQRMCSPQGRAIYKQRAAISETVNADLKTFRGLSAFYVRGLAKCRCVVLWSALAYNLMHFTETLLKT